MDEQELLIRLRDAFKSEAEERLESLATNLLNLEKVDTIDEQRPTLEVVYREAHSLKGAARAVNFKAVEMVCQAMESVFYRIRKEVVLFPASFFDLSHECIQAIRAFLNQPDPARQSPQALALTHLTDRLTEYAGRETIDEQDSNKPDANVAATAKLQAITSSDCPNDHSKSTAASWASGPKTISNPPEFKETTPKGSAPKTISGSIRVAPEKLDAILHKAEELIGLKRITAHHLADLNKAQTLVKSHLSKYDHLRGRSQSNQNKHGVHNLTVAPRLGPLYRLLESQQTCLQTVKHELHHMANFMDQYQRGLSRLTDELLGETKRTMLRPCADLFNQFPLMVREMARAGAKKVDFEITGAHIEIDRRILEQMKDPLIHLIRNAVDHGLESCDHRARAGKPQSGSLRLACTQTEGKMVEMVLTDDGKGIDLEAVKAKAVSQKVLTASEADGLNERDALRLIFKSGVSTARVVTEISGRGLGMAIVSERIETLGGHLAINSIPGSGTIYRICLPVTLATFRGVLVKVANAVFVLPSTHVRQVIRVYSDEIKTAENRQVIVWQNQATSLVDLAGVLKIAKPEKSDVPDRYFSAAVVGAGGAVAAFVVDEVLGEEEILVKDLGKQLQKVPFVAGATVLVSGKVAPILSAQDLVNVDIDYNDSQPIQPDTKLSERPRILLAEDSLTSRMLLKNILESAGYEVIATVNGSEAYAALSQTQPDIIVSDVEMPEMSGFELTQKIRQDEKFKSLPIILVTTLSSPEDRERGIHVGADAYIAKGEFDQQNLLETIQLLI